MMKRVQINLIVAGSIYGAILVAAVLVALKVIPFSSEVTMAGILGGTMMGYATELNTIAVARLAAGRQLELRDATSAIVIGMLYLLPPVLLILSDIIWWAPWLASLILIGLIFHVVTRVRMTLNTPE
jgi:hypothetical protein